MENQNEAQGLSIYELDAAALLRALGTFESVLLWLNWELATTEQWEQRCEALGFTFAHPGVWMEGGETLPIYAKGRFEFPADASKADQALQFAPFRQIYSDLCVFKCHGWKISCAFSSNRYELKTVPTVEIPGALSVDKVKTMQYLCLLVRQFVAAVFAWLRDLLRDEFWARLSPDKAMEELEHRHIRFNAHGEEI